MGADYESLLVLRVVREIERRLPKIKFATFVAAESSDADLSELTLPGGGPARFVPKISGVGTMTAGDVVMIVSPGGIGYTIIGVLQGDRTNIGDYIP